MPIWTRGTCTSMAGTLGFSAWFSFKSDYSVCRSMHTILSLVCKNMLLIMTGRLDNFINKNVLCNICSMDEYFSND